MTGFGHFPSIADLDIADLEYLAEVRATIEAEHRWAARRQARQHAMRWFRPWPQAAICDPTRRLP